MEKASILIVEDEHIVAMDIQNSLEHNGYQIVGRADRGEDAIKKAGELRPSLILMDINLKGEMDGIEAATQIRGQFDIPIIFLTAFSTQSVIERALQAESFGYILKPFEERELVITIDMALYKHNIEHKLRESENKFRSVIEYSSDGIALIDRQGRITEWNHAAEEITGFSRSEVMGQEMSEISFQCLPKENRNPTRQQVIRQQWNAVIQNEYSSGLDQNKVYEIETPQGTRRFIQNNGFAIQTDSSAIAGVLMRDVTESKQLENIIHARMRLFEYSAQHSLEELLTRTLDEVCAITNSPIGFYHFVEPDQQTLSLQAWSTRTLQEYCQAEGKGMHFDVDQAGIWMDCIRQKQPVIHNDYVSIAYRNGLPQGHAELTRELVVPILRNGLIVAVLGVGNKGQEYGQRDIDIITNFADIAWELVVRKRADIAMRKLSMAVEQSANSIVITDIEGNIEYANPKFAQVSGYSSMEVAGKNPRILRSGKHNAEFYKNLWHTIKDGMVWHGEFQNKRKDGTLFWEDSTISPVKDANGELINFIAIKEDITSRKMLEESERDQRHLAEALRDTAMILNGTLKLDDVLDRILANIGKLVNFDSAMVSLIEGDSVRKIRYHNNPGDQTTPRSIGDPQANLINIPILQTIIKTRQAYCIPDIQTDKRWLVVAIPGMQRVRSLICAPIEIQGKVAGILNVISATPDFFTELQAERVKAFASQAAVAMENAQLYEQAKRLSLTDSLTDLFNMRYFLDFGKLEFERVRRYERTLSVVMADVDHFKNVNDQHGHHVGDQVLREIAARIKNSVRAVDVVARYGGEEFIVLMPETGLEEASGVAERIRLTVSDAPIKNMDRPISVTLSLGIAEIDKSTGSLDELIKFADQALYKAKANGRNCVVSYSHEK